MRRRLDVELVRRRLVESREQAHVAIEQRRVLVGGAIAERAARQVDPSEPIELVGQGPRFVSRGGEKLDAAIDRFAVEVSGRWAFDAGASTGGFTDCLLQRGAAGVVAVDVGFGQLHERMRADVRVEVHERINLRTVDVEEHFGGRRFPLLVCDVSFISLRSVAPNLVALLDDDAALVLLVKPQFEAGRVEVSRGQGVIRSEGVWERVLHEVIDAYEALGCTMMGAMSSPIRGADGNVEFLVHLRRARLVAGSAETRVALIEDALAEAAGD